MIFTILSSGFLSAQDIPIEVTAIEDPNGTKNIEFYAQNENVGKFIVRVKFPRLQNLRSTSGYNDYVGTIGFGKTKLFTLRPMIPHRPVGYSYVYSSHRGCDRVKLKDGITYLFPFKSKEEKLVYDNKEFNDLEKIKSNSLSFMLQNNEMVYASRRGLVVDIKEHFNDLESVDSIRYKQKNYIIIQHDDCSYAKYEYLKESSVLPTVGDGINAGDPIARVGGKPTDKGYRLRYFLYYIEYDKINDKASYNYLKPNFLINNERKKLVSGGLYKSVHSIGLITQEMSKREKKKFSN